MNKSALRTVLQRELRAVRRQLEAYPDDAAVWREVPGLPNTGGTLALHLAGNLRHFFGATLGKDGYVRNRDAEFSARGASRTELIAGIEAAAAAVDASLDSLGEEGWRVPYPEPIANRRVATDQFLVHLATHLAYHLGQLDYHRRAVTGDRSGLDAVSVRELPEIA
jgi:uncharacterized damage-inducible protein DinB